MISEELEPKLEEINKIQDDVKNQTEKLNEIL